MSDLVGALHTTPLHIDFGSSPACPVGRLPPTFPEKWRPDTTYRLPDKPGQAAA
ncbi:MAG: hypothetical protein ISR97_01810, partial [Nitrospira sp.]|nr:hypothetical protein [Nitrospira sp.]